MNHRHYILPAILLFAATACSPSPSSLAENHLELLKSGNATKANQQYCLPSDTLRLYSVKSFQILSSQPKTSYNLPYTEVVAKIETDQYRFRKVDEGGVTVPEKEVIKQVTLDIWKSDDLYQAMVVSTAKLNDLKQKLGTQTKTLPKDERGEVNKQHLCVFLPFEQFESES